MAGLREELQSPNKVHMLLGWQTSTSGLSLSTMQASLASIRLLHSSLLPLT